MERRHWVIGGVLAIIIMIGVPLAAWLSGSMFYQRCQKAYPNDGLAQEQCIYRLSKGAQP